MQTEDFLNELERRQLVSDRILSQLREKAAQPGTHVNAKSILKFLVKKQLVSRPEAQQLLDTLLVVNPRAESSILGMAATPQVPKAPRPTRARPADDIPALKPEFPTSPLVPPREPPPAVFGGPSAADSKSPSKEKESDNPFSFTSSESGASGSLVASFKDSKEFPVQEDAGASPDRSARRRKKQRRPKKSEWDSPLLLFGGGGLIVLLVAGTFIYYLLFRENADALLNEAANAFDSGSYTQAIKHYERFVENFPRHSDYSSAKVRLGMARLWRATEGATDYRAALQTAEEVIEEIEDEPAFATEGSETDGLSKAKRELSSLLTRIASGLAEQAEQADQPEAVAELIEGTERVLALCGNTKYVPQRLRLDSDLIIVRETLERVRDRQKRDADLLAALAKIDEAVAGRDTAQAYSIHKNLIDRYPMLRNDSQVRSKVLEIAAAEKQFVEFLPANSPATTIPRETKIVATLSLYRTLVDASAQVSAVVAVKVDGAIYGMDASTGAVRWRKFLGVGDQTFPVMLNNQTVIDIDHVHHDLVCLSLVDGALQWRQPLAEPLGQPAVLGERLTVPGHSGKLYLLSRDDGTLLGHVQFGQSIGAPPVADPAGQVFYCVGEHSNLYSLSTEDLSCRAVYYLGHSQGSVTVPPVRVLNKLIVAENSGAQTAQLHVLSLDEAALPTQEAATARIDGLVMTGLITAGRRLAAISSLGAVGVFEVSSADGATALTSLASRESVSSAHLARFGALTSDGRESNLWVAGDQLQRLAILPTGNRLPVRSVDRDYRQDHFDHPLISLDNLLIHTRRPANSTGARIAAVEISSGKSLWETELAVAPAGPPAVNPQQVALVAGTSTGAVFAADRNALQRGVLGDSLSNQSAPRDAGPFDASLDLGAGRLVLGATGKTSLLYFNPSDREASLQEIPLPAPLACPPVAWRNGFVVATSAGQVFWHDAQTGTAVGQPFQPALRPGQKLQWLEPVPEGPQDNARLLLSDSHTKVYALSMLAEPAPHLEAVAAADVETAPHATRLAVALGRLFVGDAKRGLNLFDLPALEPGGRVDLPDEIAWGPYATDNGVLIGLGTGAVMLLASADEVLWNQPSERDVPVGAPLVGPDQLLIARRGGVLESLSLTTGETSARIELGESVATGPVGFGRLVVVAGSDGTLLFANRP
jgi:outer membrane protein assembly factor BamB/tetratricopeptide (TPR) repeat protein